MSDRTPELVSDDWLSRELGRPSLRMAGIFSPEARAVIASLPPGTFAYTKIPCVNVDDAHQFESVGFRIVDTNLTFECDCLTTVPGRPMRRAMPEDCDAIMRLAGESFRFSRFHLDPRIGSATAAAIKAAWVRNYFTGCRGTRLYVADIGDEVAGFLLAIDRERQTVIDLIAVSPRHQRQGIAAALIATLAAESTASTTLVAGTQVANVPSVRMYESLGFRLASSAYVLHYHA